MAVTRLREKGSISLVDPMDRRRLLWLILAIPRAAPAQSDEGDEPVFDLGAGINPPKVVHQVNPKPDSGTKGFRITGVVLIGLIISSRGEPRNVHVVRSVDKEIDQSAVEAVKEWRFEPARKGDKPVAVRATIEIRFQDL
jgi:TonB family protein